MAKALEENDLSIEPLLDQMLGEAVRQRASDIHIEPENEKVRVRLRVDGVLHDEPPQHLFIMEKLIIRIKVISGLDITAHETPQEGHFVWYDRESTNARELDVRVSMFPTIYGEAVVLRLLNRSESFINLEHLGFSQQAFSSVQRLLGKPTGIVLVTGPVNAGKTTTLYSLLQQLADARRNIVTLEDPVEFRLPLIRQSQIAPERGFDFATGLRSILRQDPDIIMVGEIRDAETAEIAFRTSLTGRLTFSTLHTNSTTGTVDRLNDMGIDRWLVAYSLSGIISQRLVGKICQHCKTEYQPAEEVLVALNMNRDPNERFYHGQGCSSCHQTGFVGRVGVFEVWDLDDTARTLILNRAPSSEIRQKAIDSGMQPLREDGIEKARQGLTTLEEVLHST